jgi:rubrerythrin
MAQRAQAARTLACTDPTKVDVDDELLPWVYDQETGYWFSFDGNYSSISPAQKRANALERKASDEMKKIAREMRIDKQEEYIELWSRIRQQVLDRDGYSCQMCGMAKTSKLHIHHIMKKSKGGTDHLDNLITLCPSCHSKADHKFYNPDWTKRPQEAPQPNFD